MLNLHRLTCTILHSSSLLLAYVAEAQTRTYSKHISRDHYLQLCDVTADTENTASSIVERWAVFTELLPDNMLIKSVKVSWHMSPSYLYNS
jgi:hypothetical protein